MCLLATGKLWRRTTLLSPSNQSTRLHLLSHTSPHTVDGGRASCSVPQRFTCVRSAPNAAWRAAIAMPGRRGACHGGAAGAKPSDAARGEHS